MKLFIAVLSAHLLFNDSKIKTFEVVVSETKEHLLLVKLE